MDACKISFSMSYTPYPKCLLKIHTFLVHSLWHDLIIPVKNVFGEIHKFLVNSICHYVLIFFDLFIWIWPDYTSNVNTRETCYIFWEKLINCNKLELRNTLLWISVQLWYVQPLLQGNENWPKTICLLITSSILRPINKLEANSRLIYFCGLCYFGKRKTSLYSLYSKHILP